MRKNPPLLALALAAALVPACGGGSGGDDPPASALPEVALVVLKGTTLTTYSARAPQTALATLNITGTTGLLKGIDYRPLNGTLFVLSEDERLYSVNPVSGAATLVSGAAFGTALNGPAFGVDFNPAVDRLRVVSNAGQNLRIHPDTAAVTVDAALNYVAGAPDIVAAAYTTTGVFFGIDRALDQLVTSGNPNSGALTPVGPLGIDIGDAHFDIALDNQGYLAIARQSDAVVRLRSINLTTGATADQGQIGDGTAIEGLAVGVLPAFNPGSGSIVALRDNVLLNYLPGAPNLIAGALTVTGFGGTLVGIEYHGSRLIALSNEPRLYEIDTVTGVATALGAGALPAFANLRGLDVIPGTDLLRIVNPADQNRRLDLVAGTESSADTNLAFAAADANFGISPTVHAVAYNGAGTFFGIDVGLGILVSSAAVNAGQISTVGVLGIGGGIDDAHFDISSAGVAYAALRATPAGPWILYTINTASGLASAPLGTLGTGQPIVAMTVRP